MNYGPPPTGCCCGETRNWPAVLFSPSPPTVPAVALLLLPWPGKTRATTGGTGRSSGTAKPIILGNLNGIGISTCSLAAYVTTRTPPEKYGSGNSTGDLAQPGWTWLNFTVLPGKLLPFTLPPTQAPGEACCGRRSTPAGCWIIICRPRRGFRSSSAASPSTSGIFWTEKPAAG